MTDYGDADPDDAYDASDPIAVRLFTLARIAAALADDPDPDRRAVRRANLRRAVSQLYVDI